MAKKAKAKSKSTSSEASSWWKERSKIVAKKTESKPAKVRSSKAKPKKTKKAEKGDIYYCEICGCEMVCIEPSAEVIMCCEEPMCVMV